MGSWVMKSDTSKPKNKPYEIYIRVSDYGNIDVQELPILTVRVDINGGQISIYKQLN